jgi:hypothetical protein
MNIKLTSYVFSLLASILIVQDSAYSIPTKWEDARTSMSELLKSGWQLTGHGATRVAANTSAISSGFNETTYTFILTKNNNYIICLVENPRPPIANAASCRRLT